MSAKVLSIDPKIIGGFEANKEQFPYQVSLELLQLLQKISFPKETFFLPYQ